MGGDNFEPFAGRHQFGDAPIDKIQVGLPVGALFRDQGVKRLRGFEAIDFRYGVDDVKLAELFVHLCRLDEHHDIDPAFDQPNETLLRRIPGFYREIWFHQADLFQVERKLPVNGGVKTSHVAAQKSTTSGYLERAMETG